VRRRYAVDKRKVAKLIRQVVEYAEARRVLEGEVEAARAAAAAAHAAAADERGAREAAEAALGRALHSSTSELNLSRFRHSTHPLNASTTPPPLPLTLPKHPLNTPCSTKSGYVELTGGRV
jgi:hypothetical protein